MAFPQFNSEINVFKVVKKNNLVSIHKYVHTYMIGIQYFVLRDKCVYIYLYRYKTNYNKPFLLSKVDNISCAIKNYKLPKQCPNLQPPLHRTVCHKCRKAFNDPKTIAKLFSLQIPYLLTISCNILKTIFRSN